MEDPETKNLQEQDKKFFSLAPNITLEVVKEALQKSIFIEKEWEETILTSNQILMPHSPLTVVRIPLDSQMKAEITAANKNSSEQNSKSSELTAIPKWDLVQKYLLKREIKDAVELRDVIASINPHKNRMKFFGGIVEFFERFMNKEERRQFFSQTLPKIQKLVFDIVKVFPLNESIPLLVQNEEKELILTRYQIATLLANAFFCTFMEWQVFRDSKGEFQEFPRFNLYDNLWRLRSEGIPPPEATKIRCIIHYFERITEADSIPDGKISFQRKVLQTPPNWFDFKIVPTDVSISSTGAIEEAEGMTQVDFANKFIGGGVLCGGCVQEEIRFAVCTEMIASLLFTAVMKDNESLVIRGAEQFTKYTGYGKTFGYGGDFRDKTPKDEEGYINIEVLAIDAIHFRQREDQFNINYINRELNKAYCGFRDEKKKHIKIATGNWGCGVFNGDKQLKFIIQIIAASAAGRGIKYYTFNDAKLAEELTQMHKIIVDWKVQVAQLYNLILKYQETAMSDEGLEQDLNMTLFSYLEKAITSKRFCSVM